MTSRTNTQMINGTLSMDCKYLSGGLLSDQFKNNAVVWIYTEGWKVAVITRVIRTTCLYDFSHGLDMMHGGICMIYLTYIPMLLT